MAATPICRCRVLYLGSAVPHASKDGLQGIQGPLRELYPEGGARGARGIDSWLSVWSNGLLLENVDEHRQEVTRFFPISSLHYCAAVRHVLVPERGGALGATSPAGSGSNSGAAQPRFLPLDSPFAAAPSTVHPPLFAAILRRTTGIKVLECHVFICKREAAANALVRCCFHAYADSSYAKHIDGGGGGGGDSNSPESIYGTLRGENWRRASSTSLSNGHSHHHNGTIDFDSADGEVDDGSVYNGDENHKVWAGREDEDKDNVYGYGGSSSGATLRSRGRSARPRQVAEPVPPPPPPPPPSSTPTKSDKEKNRERISPKVRDMRHAAAAAAAAMAARPRSAMSLGMHMHPHAPPMPRPVPPHMMTLPPPGRMFAVPMAAGGRRPPPGFVFAPPPPPPPHFVATLGRRRLAAEEPVYMPSARPLSPVASYQPGHFPHDAYLMQHYATATLDGRAGKKKKKGKKNGVPMPVPIPVLIPPPPPSQLNGAAVPMPVAVPVPTASPENHHQHQHDSSGENSPSGTGIYRKKGHLNERAFSYSIRQEHRSRSHGSLASLKFAAPASTNSATNSGPSNSTDHKKEREIVHMMRGLDLMGDDLERSEVPPAVLNAAKQSNSRSMR